MSPDSSDYRNGDFEYESDESVEYRRQINAGKRPSPDRPGSPSSKSLRKGKKSPSGSFNGIQRRRNKHWNW